MNDEDIEAFEASQKQLFDRGVNEGLIALDGEWGSQTAEIAKQLNSTGFSLNNWWVLTSPDWTCPACNRPKREIAKINRHGDMMGHLVTHHDHMGDYLADRFHQISGSLVSVTADPECKRFVRRSASTIAAYDPIVICVDCNSADGEAKKIIPTHKWFSFSPAEISEFVIPGKNREHRIDTKCAKEIWENRKLLFQHRLQMAEQIATLAATNKHWYQEADPRDHPESLEKTARRVLDFSGLPDLNLHYFVKFSRSLRTPPADTKRWRYNFPRKGGAPSQSQIDHVAKVTHKPHWQLVTDNWKCPACRRSKIEVVRPSNKAPWAFRVDQKRLLDLETADFRQILLCGDCCMIRDFLAKDAGVPGELITLSDIEAAVIAKAHSSHTPKTEPEIEALIETIKARDFTE